MELHNNNCLDEMECMVDDSADIVVTSPPYNMNLRIRNGEYCSRHIVKELSTKHENFDDNLSMEEYYDFNHKVITECLRIAPLVFYNVQFLTGNKVALFKLIGTFAEQLKEVIVWDKKTAQPVIGEHVLNRQFEVILVFDRDNAISRKFDIATFERGTLSNVWRIPRSKKKTKGHGAVFPQDLIDIIVRNFTKEGDIVFDPFMGTGTTGVVCKDLGRDFIGVEMDEKYFKIAKETVENTPFDRRIF